MEKLVSPYIRVAMYDIQTTHFKFDRTIWDYELIYIQEGKMKVTVDGKHYECQPGDFILLKPREHHILEAGSEKVIQPHVHFDLIEDDLSKEIFVPFVQEKDMSPKQKTWFREDLLPKYGFDLPTVIRVYDSYSIKDILLKLINEFTYKNLYSEYLEKSLLIELLSELSRSYNAAINQSIYGRHYQDIDIIVKYILDNADKNISLDDLSNVSNISKFYLSRIFKSALGVSPYKYISQVRLKRAKQLIQFTNLSMSSIAEKMNFPDQQTFSRWFKQFDGNSPGKYRINKNARDI